MSIYDFSAVIAAIQTVNAAITGVTSAPTAMPAALNDTDLPCALTMVESFTWSEQAVGLSRRDATYAVRVLVKAVAQGQSIDEGYQNVLTLLQAFWDKYAAENDGGRFGGKVEQITEFSGDIAPLTFAGISYQGFTIRLKVVEK